MSDDANSEKEIAAETRISRTQDADVPHIYVNGFQTGLTNSDLVLACERNGQPAALINMSFTTAKTLAIALHNTISSMEEKTGRTMFTTQDFDRLMSEGPDGTS
jgi:hypothetical protein